MCGIAGVVTSDGSTPAADVILRMARCLAHRGPDGEGVDTGPGYGFGHRRLSIIDLSGGAQPMADASGRFTVTFNGEIYNFLELRSALVAHGRRFRTRSDTEVLVELVAREWTGAVPRLGGMFAFGVWDAGSRR